MKSKASCLYINFDTSKTLIVEVLQKAKNNIDVIDFTGLLLVGDVQNKGSIIQVRESDCRNEIELKSQKELADFVGRMASKVKGFKVNGLPLFYLTEFSIKHPVHHFAPNFWFFLELINSNQEFIEKINGSSNVKLVFNSSFSKSWEKHFKSKLKDFQFEFVYPKQNQMKLFFMNFKRCLGQSFDFLFDRKNDSVLINSGKLFIGNSVDSKNDIDYRLVDNNEFDYLCLCDEKSKYVVENYKLNQIQRLFLINLYFFLILKKWVRYLLLRKAPGFLKSEILQVVFEFKFFQLFTNVKNYFSLIDRKLDVWYTNEFYIKGRIYSAAIKHSKNNNIRTYGFQHAHIGAHHTVYRISKFELDNEMPHPFKFVVWGDYYKDLLLEINGFDSDYILCNPPSIYNRSNDFTKKEFHDAGDTYTILWCTTLFESAKIEYEFLMSLLLNSNMSIKVNIRLHPLHDIKNKLIDLLYLYNMGGQFEFDENRDVLQSIEANNLIVSSNTSSIFLDALFCNKPVVIISTRKFIDINVSLPGIAVTYTEQDFISSCQHFLASRTNKVEASFSYFISKNSSTTIKNA